MDAQPENNVVMDYVGMMSRPCHCLYPVRYGWGTGTATIIWSAWCNNCGGRFDGR